MVLPHLTPCLCLLVWEQGLVKRAGPGRPGEAEVKVLFGFNMCVYMYLFVKVLFEFMKNPLAMKPFEGDVMLPNESDLGW